MLLLAVIPIAGAIAQTTVSSTTAPWNWTNLETSSVREETWAQTFRTPDAFSTTLDSWSFWWGTRGATFNSASARLQIFEWDGGLVGAALFTSDLRTPTVFHRTEAAFAVGRALDPSRTYAALFNPDGIVGSEARDGGHDKFWITCDICTGSTHYADGQLFRLQASYSADGTRRDVVDMPVIAPFATYDAEFRATFSPTSVVPEPASLVLLASGLAGLAGAAYARRRRR